MNRCWLILALATWPVGTSLMPLLAVADEPPKKAAQRLTEEERKTLLAQREELWKRAQALDKEGRVAEALVEAEKALAIQRRALGDSHEGVAGALEWIAQRREQREEFDAAEKLRTEVVAIKEKLRGKDHWQATDARLALADVALLRKLTPDQRSQLASAEKRSIEIERMSEEGKAREAIPAAVEVMNVRRQVLGDMHRHYASSLNALGELCTKTAEYAKAEPLYHQAIAIRKAVLGEKHPEHAESLSNIASLQYRLGNYAQAELLFRQSLQIRKTALGEKHADYAQSLNNLAAVHYAMGDYAKSEPLYRASLEITKSILGEKHPDYARTLHNLAFVYKSMAEYAKAEPLFRQSLEITKAVKGEKHPEYANSLNSLAVLYNSMGNHAQAEPLYRQALEIRKVALGEKHPEYANSLANLGSLYSLMGKYAQAEPLYRQALEIRKLALGEKHPEYARSLDDLGSLYTRMGKYAQAEPLCRQALEIRKGVLGERHPLYATSLTRLSQLYKLMGDHSQAEPLYRQALEIHKAVSGEKHPEYATTLNDLGHLYRLMGDYARAELLHRQALDIQKAVVGEKHLRYAQCLDGLALLHQSTGNYAQAEPLFRQALEVRKATLGEKHPGYADSLNNLASLYQSMGDHSRAASLHGQSLEITKAVLGEKSHSYAISLHNLATLYESIGDYAKAQRTCRQALEILKAALGEKHPDYASFLNNLAKLHLSMGEHAKAEVLWRQTLQIQKTVLGERHPNYATSLNNLAALHFLKREYAKAEPLHHQALEIRQAALGEKHPDYANSLNNLASVYESMGDYARAQPLRRRALEIDQQLLAETVAAQCERQQLQMAQAFAGTLNKYVTLSLAPEAMLPSDEVYRHILASKGATFARQALLWQLRNDPSLQDRFDDYLSVCTRLATRSLATPTPAQRAAWLKDIERLTEQKERLEADFSQSSAAFRERQSLAALTPVQLQGHLPKDAALVDFLEYSHYSPPKGGKRESERRIVAFVVRSQGEVQSVPLGPVAPIAAAIEAWRKKAQAMREDPKAAQELREKLWAKLEGPLAGARTVLISPDGALSGFPFAALPGEKPGTYLIEERALAVVPVPQLLPKLLTSEATEASPRDSLLLVGDMDYGNSPGTASDSFANRSAPGHRERDGKLFQYAALEHAGDEMTAVSKLFARRFAKDGSQELRRERATEAAFRTAAAKHRYLHVVTHGFFAPPEVKSALQLRKEERDRAALFGREGITGFHPGLLSGLALTGANARPQDGQDDGILTALEVAGLDLRRVDLAVLSACETGLGETAGGEGLLGLQRAFQAAGARSTVASLWKVQDAATRALMEEFYQNLWVKKMSKLEALRQAQLTMLLGYEPKEGKLRAGFGKSPVDPKTLQAARERLKAGQGLSPFYWAAFVLSGDWR